jgi:hypothetical protein
MSIRYDRQYKQNIDNEPFDMSNNGYYRDDTFIQYGGGGAGTIKFNTIEPLPAPVKSAPVTSTTPLGPLDPDYLINYEILFTSNLQNEVGNLLKLKYEIVSADEVILSSGNLDLENSNTDAKESLKSNLLKSKLRFYIEGNLPSNYKIIKIFYANRQLAEKNSKDVSKWKVGDKYISVPASELLTGGFAVSVVMEKEILANKPIINVPVVKYDYNVKDSDSDRTINIPFASSNTDFVDCYIDSNTKIRVNSTQGFVDLSFKKDFSGVYGSKKIILVPYSNIYGTGDRVDIIVNFITVNDFPSITQITFPNSVDVPSFSDLNIEYEIDWNSFSVSSIDVDLVAKNNSRIPLFKSLQPNGKLKINLKDLRDKFKSWSGSDNVTLIFKPYNRSGAVELVGNEYEIKSSLLLPTINLNEDIIKKSLFDAFVATIKFTEPEKESKFLTHLVNFGNDEQTIISSWEEDNFTLSDKGTDELGNTIVTKEVESLILKLYTPLSSNVNENSTLWISKLLTNPLIETVILTEQSDLKCPPLKGPNFDIDIDFVKGKSTNFESIDDLILNTNISSSNELVSTYLSSSLMNTDGLNIEYYVSSSTNYAWDNFVHFSSAKERVENFIYKVQLIEAYEDLIVSSSTNYTNGNVGSYTGSLSSLQETERQTLKKNQIVNGFDGFEKFLYTPSNFTTINSGSITWPYSGSDRLNSTNTNVYNWYSNLVELAGDYDNQNRNYILNNIPQYIVNNEENTSLLLFFSMIGQHFDNIYYHTKSIEKSRNLGYKSKSGIADDLLFDTLKSFNWDAKNLASDTKLWSYVFGDNLDNTELNPAKQRTYEVWRRIVNNLPYLLKHKGTRRGIYALLSCYGIPSSNLSILEFGGPEVTTLNKSKLVYDNVTTALKMDLTSSIQIGWGATNNTSSLRPNTIEFFIKPYDNLNYTLISGSGWNVALTASLSDNNLGYVAFNYNTTNSLTSSLLPIFNGQFFGVSVSSGSTGLKLDVRQSNKERTIFQESITASVATNWNNGDTIRFGTNYSGSVDEFRMWSSQLDTQRFYEHVSFPEMINGNDIFGSTDELHFRLDFEYPKNLDVYRILPNVDTNIYYPSIQLNPSSSLQLTRNILEETGSINFDAIKSENPMALYSASAFGFSSKPDYPFNFEPIDRSVVLEIPDLGASRYSTNKVRFESQTDFNGNDVSGGINLSVKTRTTKKAFDQSPTDSNRVGLFFSPTKELNIDIAKSFGGINLDNYIGDPSDFYKSNYKRLDDLRHYYFQRFDNRDIYAYINLIKLYEKSMFEDIKKMLPARVKATTGLLIEPHILERSKIAQKKPTAEDYQQGVTIHYADTTILTADNEQYETIIDVNLSENLFGENEQYEGEVYNASIDSIIGENNQYDSLIGSVSPSSFAESYQENVEINAGLDNPTILTEIDIYDINTIVGQSDYENIGFGIYAQNGYAIRTYFDANGRRVKERIKVDLIKEEKRRDIVAYNIKVNGKGDPRGGYYVTSSIYYETKLNIQPFSGSKVINAGTDSIVEVIKVDGYLPTHHRNTSDLTTGLKNSYYLGSKNTAATTLDGTSPVETFNTNPNTLRVNKAGRDASEPILQVE